MKLFKLIDLEFSKANDTKLIQDRKSVLLDGTFFGLSKKVLVYPKASLSEISIGDSSIVKNFRVIDIVRKSPFSRDGYVVCCIK